MSPEALKRGDVVGGRYRLEQRIGAGGMGTLWRAYQLELDVHVAVKFMSPELVGSAIGRERFRREARAAARLRSPHVVGILDYGLHAEQPYIAMELLQGQDLAQRLSSGRRHTLAEVALIVTHVAKALRVAHEAGIVHRDLKPANLFLTEVAGEKLLKVLDFGIAKPMAIEPRGADTSSGILLGSPFYMSPEQVRGAAVDAQSDLWSLGVIAYELLTGGRPPFSGATLGDLFVRICGEDPAPPSSHCPALGAPIDAFFRRALARDKHRRFASAEELAAAFVSAVASVPAGQGSPEAAPPEPAEPFGRLDETLAATHAVIPETERSRIGRRRRVALVATASLLAAGAGVLALTADHPPPGEAQFEDAAAAAPAEVMTSLGTTASAMPTPAEPTPAAPSSVERAPVPPPSLPRATAKAKPFSSGSPAAAPSRLAAPVAIDPLFGVPVSSAGGSK